jgi:hypothetical protein
MVTWSCCFGPGAVQYIIVGMGGRGGFSLYGSQETKTEGNKAYPPSVCPQPSDFLTLGPPPKGSVTFQ